MEWKHETGRELPAELRVIWAYKSVESVDGGRNPTRFVSMGDNGKDFRGDAYQTTSKAMKNNIAVLQ